MLGRRRGKRGHGHIWEGQDSRRLLSYTIQPGRPETALLTQGRSLTVVSMERGGRHVSNEEARSAHLGRWSYSESESRDRVIQSSVCMERLRDSRSGDSVSGSKGDDRGLGSPVGSRAVS